MNQAGILASACRGRIRQARALWRLAVYLKDAMLLAIVPTVAQLLDIDPPEDAKEKRSRPDTTTRTDRQPG
jgi:hypothetical protein